jgi:hypothetical protein
MILLITFALVLPLAEAADEKPLAGTLETVAKLPTNPRILAVTAEGRVFATVHQFRRADGQLIGEYLSFNATTTAVPISSRCRRSKTTCSTSARKDTWLGRAATPFAMGCASSTA